MATKRRPPPKKQPSPPPPQPAPPLPDDQLEEDERSSSEDEDSDENASGSPPARATPNPPRALAVAASAADNEEDGEDDSDESTEEDSESEEEKPNPSLQKSSIARPDANGKPSLRKPDPVSESEEEDSDSDEEEGNPTPVNTAAARPGNASGNPPDKQSLPESESEEEDSESEEEQRAPADAKGTPSVPVSKSGKVAAASPESAMGDTAKKLFQRIWSDDDQIALLQGMVEYVDEKGKDPVADIKDFWLFIRNKLSFPVTELQLMTKIRTVRKKYIGNQKKDRALKAYDAKVFDLSKKIWDAAKKNPDAVKKNKVVTENDIDKKRKIAPSDSDKEGVWDCPREELTEHMLWKDGFVDLCRELFGWDENSAWAKVNSMDESEMKSFEPRWKKLKTEEVRSFERRRLLEFESLGTIF